MTKYRDRLRECTGFQWDEGNATKNRESHDVTQAECEETFFNQPFVVRRDRKHSRTESRLYGLGRTDAGRLLFIDFTIRGDKVRVISARDMTPAENQRYPK